jgi:AraC family transcriptional regulator, carnitine catabolism transcriptional activator
MRPSPRASKPVAGQWAAPGAERGSDPLLETQEFHFLLLPEFSVMGFASAVEPLRVANRFVPEAYRWKILSLDGGPVRASNGMSLNVDAALDRAHAVQTLFVVAGFNPLQHYQSALGEALRQLDRQGATLGAIDTGAFVLAQARLLSGHPVTLHWEAQSAFKERFPALTVTQELIEWGQRRISCAGGTAAMDMVLALIGQRHGQALAATVSEQFLHGPVRSPSEHQRTEVVARFGVHDKKLVQAIQTMQAHLEEVLPIGALAAAMDVTRRQMERLFAAHLQVSPAAFYLSLRLDRARQLLEQSDMGVMAIAVACGFSGPSHFSRAYRRRFGVRPKDERSRTR